MAKLNLFLLFLSTLYLVVSSTSRSAKMILPVRLVPFDADHLPYKPRYLSFSSSALSANCPNHDHPISLTSSDLTNAINYAKTQLTTLFPEYLNQTHYTQVSAAALEVEGQVLELVAEYFVKYKCLPKHQLPSFLSHISAHQLYPFFHLYGNASCTLLSAQKFQCSRHFTSRYRTFDGSCNNLFRPHWGRANTCHSRVLPPDYADGLAGFRVSTTGLPLPLPRQISNIITPSRDIRSAYTSLVLSWGQFIAHDITLTSGIRPSPKDQAEVNCCLAENAKCSTIWLMDEVEGAGNRRLRYSGSDSGSFSIGRCTNFMRSHPCPKCLLGPRSQMNLQTAFIDCSHIYGTSPSESATLRTFRNGQLKASLDLQGKPILPIGPDATPCSPLTFGQKCFLAGDKRVNQHPLLILKHLLWLRAHNLHASRLAEINTHWDDERLFQEARRITIAEVQHVTFKEYLPLMLGPTLMRLYRLNPLQTGYTTYQEHLNPSTRTEYAIAGRFGHSQIKDTYLAGSVMNSSWWKLKDNFFEPGFAWAGLTDDLIRGTTTDQSAAIDPYFSRTAKNFISRLKSKPFGIDLVATNILRSRDHGVPGYIHYLKVCFNYKATSWTDLKQFIPQQVLDRLQALYNTIDDIDLYIGGVAERHYPGAQLGPTFGCLVGQQFHHLKFGDRYYYEHGGQVGSLTPGQLETIRQTTSMARILCQTANHLEAIQKNPFLPPSAENRLLYCAQYAELDYEQWREW